MNNLLYRPPNILPVEEDVADVIPSVEPVQHEEPPRESLRVPSAVPTSTVPPVVPAFPQNDLPVRVQSLAFRDPSALKRPLTNKLMRYIHLEDGISSITNLPPPIVHLEFNNSPEWSYRFRSSGTADHPMFTIHNIYIKPIPCYLPPPPPPPCCPLAPLCATCEHLPHSSEHTQSDASRPAVLFKYFLAPFPTVS
eukprot:GHVR01111680.1.p1 GENE.GHVR01111680.1~~GHVR01111680.1.p1  ORF type:complete len:195 (-),score=20.47 GHVR01111680.1:719-1303(-)